MYAVWKDGAWSQEAELASTTVNSVHGSLNLDTSDHPIVIYSSSDDGFSTSHHFCRPYPQGCTTNLIIPSLLTFANESLFADTSGGVVIVTEGLELGVEKVYYSYWKNGTLVINKHEIGGSVNYRNGLLDHQNNVLFYRTGSVPIPGGNVTGLYQQCLSANATWGKEWAISGQSKVGYYKYAISAGNNIVSGWQSAYGTPVVLDLWDNCVSIKNKPISLPPPSTSSWGALSSLAVSDQPRKICLLMPILYTSSKYGVYCVDIAR